MSGDTRRDLRAYLPGGPRAITGLGTVYRRGKPVKAAPRSVVQFTPGQANVGRHRLNEQEED